MTGKTSMESQSPKSYLAEIERLKIEVTTQPIILKDATITALFLDEEESEKPAVVLFKDTNGTLSVEIWPMDAYDFCCQPSPHIKRLRGLRVDKGELIHHEPVETDEGIEDVFFIRAFSQNMHVVGTSSGELKYASIIRNEGGIYNKLKSRLAWVMQISTRTPVSQQRAWKEGRSKLPRRQMWGLIVEDQEEGDEEDINASRSSDDLLEEVESESSGLEESDTSET
ncbi:hypothetical protein Dda_2978 [Drechslerella dactyloides]|uniref:Uncharacterized protein n=1 Tax=Drechslerella dactyloides TaxID=74499 RepID=A0AAD6J0L2_DREDA|nr:hypothetical protein Dda_2978 [Drechslerella dactyloides]